MAGHTNLTDPVIKQRIIELRAQGHTLEEIETALREQYGRDAAGCSISTVRRFLISDEARPLVAIAEQRIRATVAQETSELVPKAFQALRGALEAGEARDADSYGRVVTALTRGFVAERVEMTPPKTTSDLDELTALLMTHGVKLEASGKTAERETRE